jgi:hypothetical protein
LHQGFLLVDDPVGWTLELCMTVLSSEEGQLLLVSVAVDPRRLEFLLETLAGLEFPLNPEIYHDACLVYEYADGQCESVPATLVEFPTYEGHLKEVNNVIAAAGFDPSAVRAINMLDQIHSERLAEPAPAGSNYVTRYRLKRKAKASGL